jgi:alpha-beta hydrolase superfamily lysophospholipase
MRERGVVKYDEDVDIVYYKWYQEGVTPKAVIHISHGMAEHILRHESLALRLVEAGFVVYGEDHYAHGESVKDVHQIGIIKDGDFLSTIIEDMKMMVDIIKREYPHIPIYGFCHSLGGFAAQRYIELYPGDYMKVIISGSKKTSLEHYYGRVLAKLIICSKGELHYSKLAEKLSMDKFNKPYKNLPDKNHWLTSVDEVVDAYNHDQYCGAQFPANYYYSIAKLMTIVNLRMNYRRINPNLRIFVIGGSDDPVSAYGKGTQRLGRFYRHIGHDSRYKVYQGGRHELFNEVPSIKEEAIKDIISFYDE